MCVHSFYFGHNQNNISLFTRTAFDVFSGTPERERERETERETERQRDRETERQRQRQREREKTRTEKLDFTKIVVQVQPKT